MRERDDDAVAAPYESGELVLRLGQAARGDRRSLCLECERLAAWERIELRGVAQSKRRQRLLLEHVPYVVGLPDEVRRPVDGGYEIEWRVYCWGNLPVSPDPFPWAVVADRRLDQVEPPLRRRVHDC
jgi:hypothetical protein